MPSNKPGYDKEWYHANKEHMREYRQKNRNKRKNIALRYYFGITLEKYEEMRDKQGGACAICLMTPKETLAVDHDHVTNQVRGLLCTRCNVAMERIDMIENWSIRALEYKERSKKKEQS